MLLPGVGHRSQLEEALASTPAPPSDVSGRQILATHSAVALGAFGELPFLTITTDQGALDAELIGDVGADESEMDYIKFGAIESAASPIRDMMRTALANLTSAQLASTRQAAQEARAHLDAVFGTCLLMPGGGVGKADLQQYARAIILSQTVTRILINITANQGRSGCTRCRLDDIETKTESCGS